MDAARFYNSLYSPLELIAYKVATKARKKRQFLNYYVRSCRPRPEILKFKDCQKGNRCFIMGGGPSLRLIDPTPLRNEVTFGVNGVFLIFDWLGFEPTYYTVEDRLVYEDRKKQIVENVKGSTCFFPVQFKDKSFARPDFNFFRALYEFDNSPSWPNFSQDLSKVVWIGGTVTYVCLQLAYYMGCNPVYLIGVDHNYSRPEHVTAEGNVWQSHGADPNHFHPDYFGAGYRWHNPRVDRMEKAYLKARTVYEADGRQVINATVGGKLEVFERVDYASLF